MGAKTATCWQKLSLKDVRFGPLIPPVENLMLTKSDVAHVRSKNMFSGWVFVFVVASKGMLLSNL